MNHAVNVGLVVAAVVILVVLLAAVVALVLAKGDQDITTCIASAGLGTGGAMIAAGAAGLRQREADRDAEVLDAIGADDPELADLLERIDAEIARGES